MTQRPLLPSTLFLACALLCLSGELGAARARRESTRARGPAVAAREALGQGRDGEAVLAYKKLLDRRDQPELRCEYAFALARLGLRDAALAQLDQAVAKQKPSGDAAYFQARVLRLAGLDSAAKELGGEENAPDWLKKTALGPLPGPAAEEDPRRAFLNANRLAADGRPHLAAAEFAAALKRRPQDALGWLGFSLALEKLGAIEAAREAVDKAAAVSGKPAALSDLVKARQARLAPKTEARLSRREARRLKAAAAPATDSRVMVFAGGSFGGGSAALTGRVGYFLKPKLDLAVDLSLGGLSASGGAGPGSSVGYGAGMRRYWPLGDAAKGAAALGARVGYVSVQGQDGVATVTVSPGFTSPLGDAFLDITVSSTGLQIGFTVGATTYLGGRAMKALGLLLSLALGATAHAAPDLLAGHEEAFESVAFKGGLLKAVASEDWPALGSAKQAKAIRRLMLDAEDSLQDLQGPLLLQLQDGEAGALWALPEGARAPRLMEAWDKTQALSPPSSKAGRWFTYLGAGLSYGVPKTLDSMTLGYNLGFKVGTFLLNDLLDLGVSLNGGGSYGINETSTDSSVGLTTGLFGRLHFPIAGPLGGHVGGEGSWNGSTQSTDSYAGRASSSSSSSSEGALLAGISLFFPSGSLDFDARFATATTYNVGITTLLGGPRRQPKAPLNKPSPSATKTRTPQALATATLTLSPTGTKTATPGRTPTLLPSATPLPTEAPTALPTQVPTAVPTQAPTAVPTAAPTPKPTVEGTPEPKPTAAATAEPRAQTDGPAPAFNPEWAFSLRGSWYQSATLDQLVSLGSNRTSASGPMNSFDDRNADLAYGLGLAWRGLGLHWTHSQHGSEFPSRSPAWQASGTGPVGQAQLEYTMEQMALGYDLGLHRMFGALGPIQFYLPLRLEFTLHSLQLSGGSPGTGGFQAQSIGGSGGLGLRAALGRYVLLSVWGRAHMGDGSDFEGSGGGIQMSQGNARGVYADASGVEVGLDLGLVSW